MKTNFVGIFYWLIAFFISIGCGGDSKGPTTLGQKGNNAIPVVSWKECGLRCTERYDFSLPVLAQDEKRKKIIEICEIDFFQKFGQTLVSPWAGLDSDNSREVFIFSVLGFTDVMVVYLCPINAEKPEKMCFHPCGWSEPKEKIEEILRRN